MDELIHIGTKRHSGRYPWGSGEEPYQGDEPLSVFVNKLKAKGVLETDIAKSLGMSTTELRKQIHISKTQKRNEVVAEAIKLRDKGWSNSAIARKMNINESSVRSLLNPTLKERSEETGVLANFLKDRIDSGQYLDVGSGTEIQLAVSRTKLNNAIAILEKEGYVIHNIMVKQVGTDKYTILKTLAPPGSSLKEVSKNRDKIIPIDGYSDDNGLTFSGIKPPVSIDSKRILVKYKEDGGDLKDGVIELRRGVDDLSLGESRYAQVRVLVDKKKYMKGMAIYGDAFPDGVDIIYNSSKPRPENRLDGLKNIEDDADNPFGSTVRQKHYLDKNGKKQLSPLNIVGSKEGAGEEGGWEKWSKTLSSQMLSKQSPALIKQQLTKALSRKEDELNEILSLTNPTVKKALLMSFADQAEAASVHLKAAALPRQSSRVLIPLVKMKENEIYAPNYRDGETVVLIRHPHGGIFEIPSLKVNNKNQEGKRVLGDAADAVGIHPNVAKKLSGADFDGDTVIVIPNNNKAVKTAPSIKSLVEFDPRQSYKGYEGMKKIKPETKQTEMGKVSNLITDMTIKGASLDEIARAVKHSMTVIDSEKHNLNYKQSEIDFGIAALKKKYQGGSTAGASTLVSKASSIVRVPKRKEGRYITDPKTGKKKRVYFDPETGDKLYTETPETYVNKAGKVKALLTKTTNMEKARNARELSSGTIQENLYADHANSLKNLARSARKKTLGIKDIAYNPSARKLYAKEVKTLNAKIALALRNKPQERQAQLIANSIIAAKKRNNPALLKDKDALKKLKGRELDAARLKVGAKKNKVTLTDLEWVAIMAGAISPSALKQILQNGDMDDIKRRSIPIYKRKLPSAKLARARAMKRNGENLIDIADSLGVSVSVLTEALKGETLNVEQSSSFNN